MSHTLLEITTSKLHNKNKQVIKHTSLVFTGNFGTIIPFLSINGFIIPDTMMSQAQVSLSYLDNASIRKKLDSNCTVGCRRSFTKDHNQSRNTLVAADIATTTASRTTDLIAFDTKRPVGIFLIQKEKRRTALNMSSNQIP